MNTKIIAKNLKNISFLSIRSYENIRIEIIINVKRKLKNRVIEKKLKEQSFNPKSLKRSTEIIFIWITQIIKKAKTISSSISVKPLILSITVFFLFMITPYPDSLADSIRTHSAKKLTFFMLQNCCITINNVKRLTAPGNRTPLTNHRKT